MTTTRPPRRSAAAAALDAVGALGPGRLLPCAVLLGGLSLAAIGPLFGDPYATGTGLTVAGLAVAGLLARHALLRGNRRSIVPIRLRSIGRSPVQAARCMPAERATPQASSRRTTARPARVDPLVEQYASGRTAGRPHEVPSQVRRQPRREQGAPV
jgi:hypothetical protein